MSSLFLFRFFSKKRKRERRLIGNAEVILGFLRNRTIGDITTRPGRPGTWTGWNTETMGVHELLDFCELVGATAILGTYAGYSLDGSTSPDIDAIASEVVNQLHYITDTSGQWADLRKANGRAQPWDLTKVEIGNEVSF